MGVAYDDVGVVYDGVSVACDVVGVACDVVGVVYNKLTFVHSCTLQSIIRYTVLSYKNSSHLMQEKIRLSIRIE